MPAVAQPARRRVAAVQSANVLEDRLRSFRGDLTIADAAARGGVTVVVVGYAVVLLGVLIALALKDDRGDGVGDALALVFRIVAEALFWTFHPLSPVIWQTEPAWTRLARRHQKPKVPFYERVNRFVFGPPRSPVDPRAEERSLVAEIRRLEGRVAPGDIMRVTG